MYGKDNRILYSAKCSQGFKVVAATRTGQAAGVPNGGTTIWVTGARKSRGEDVSCGPKARPQSLYETPPADNKGVTPEKYHQLW
jgi:hypothetical protein